MMRGSDGKHYSPLLTAHPALPRASPEFPPLVWSPAGDRGVSALQVFM